MGARGKFGIVSLALSCVLATTSIPAVTALAQGRCEQPLAGCGICYPGGYDVNTAGSVRGELIEIQVPADGPVRLTLADGPERWVVLASPAWFWNMAALNPVKGDVVTVHGSKTLGADGTLYVIAREIRTPASGAPVALRDPLGAPLWKHGSLSGIGRGGSGNGPSGEGPGRGRGGVRGRK